MPINMAVKNADIASEQANNREADIGDKGRQKLYR